MQVPLWQSWLLQVAVGLRTRVVHQPYGDQGLFVRKSTLQELGVSTPQSGHSLEPMLWLCMCRMSRLLAAAQWLLLLFCRRRPGRWPLAHSCASSEACLYTAATPQGYKEWKLLEDYALVQQLNKLSPPAIVPKPVITSGRLYKAAGFWEVIAVHQRILYEYTVAGTSPDRLQQLRAGLLKKQDSRCPCRVGS